MTLHSREKDFSKIYQICKMKVNATFNSVKYFYIKLYRDMLLAFIFYFSFSLEVKQPNRFLLAPRIFMWRGRRMEGKDGKNHVSKNKRGQIQYNGILKRCR